MEKVPLPRIALITVVVVATGVLTMSALKWLGYFVYSVRGILPPFVIAFAIAWLLDPLLDRLQRRGVPRVAAVAAVYVTFLALFVIGIRFLIPVIVHQAGEFGEAFPKQYDRFSKFATDFMTANQDTLSRLGLPRTLDEVTDRYRDQATTFISKGLISLKDLLASNLGKVMWLILIPLAGFYLLNDIDSIRRKSVLFIPQGSRERVASVLSRMGQVFSNYVRGLIIVCALYGLATILFLTIARLQFGFVLGLVAGLLYAVPYVGALLTLLLVFVVSLTTYTGAGAVAHALVITAIQLGLNFAFDYGVTPRVLGRSVGLHPVLSLFALIAGGSLFGLMGMILSVPIAASIQEVVYEFYPALKRAPEKPRSPKRGSPRRSS